MAQVLRQLPPLDDPNVLIGLNTADDAAVYRLTDELALVQTVDFFTPVVDDPYSFGCIAAANSLSDVYAMGARPLLALNLVAFPAGKLPLSVLMDILRGGTDKAREAGISIVGGHSIDDPEPKYGLAVTGLVHPNRVLPNSGARVGDELILTKPLGLGIITTGIKAELVAQELVDEVVGVMATLNKIASGVMVEVGVNACTDVTGFGLLGHLHEVTEASGVGARIYLNRIPVIPKAWELVEQGVVPGGTHANRRFLVDNDAVSWDSTISDDAQLVLCDAQTSGGLLIVVPPHKSAHLQSALLAAGVPSVARIGEIVADSYKRIRVLA